MRSNPPINEILAYFNVVSNESSDGEIKFLCPFHVHEGKSRHNASINSLTGRWLCYSCGASGNIVHFIGRKLDKSIRYAKLFLKEHFGYDIDEAIFYDSEKREYCGIEFRRLPKTYRPISYMHPFISKNGYSFDLMQDLGVGIDLEKNKDGSFKRQKQILIPYTWQGRTVGWIYKVMGGKYILKKSFKKRRFLYAYDWAARESKVVIVEGPRDCWRLRGFGVNAVALGGAVASEYQINAIMATWSDVEIALDGDKAGRRGSVRLANELTGIVHKVNIVLMPTGIDPNDLHERSEYEKLKRLDARFI